MISLIRRILAILALAVSTAPILAATCSSANDFSLGEHLPKPTLGIRIFDMKVRSDSPMRKMEHLRIDLAEAFRVRLMESGYFSSVTILAEDSDEVPDFTMIGTFTQATIGTNGFNLYNILTQEVFDTASTVKVVGGILRGKDPEPVTTFQCELACCRPVIASPLPEMAKTGMQKAEQSIAQIAEELKRIYARMANPKVRKGLK